MRLLVTPGGFSEILGGVDHLLTGLRGDLGWSLRAFGAP